MKRMFMYNTYYQMHWNPEMWHKDHFIHPRTGVRKTFHQIARSVKAVNGLKRIFVRGRVDDCPWENSNLREFEENLTEGWGHGYMSSEDAVWGPTLNWHVTLSEDNEELSRLAYFHHRHFVIIVEFIVMGKNYHPYYDLRTAWADIKYGQCHSEPKDISESLFESHETFESFFLAEVLTRIDGGQPD